MTERDFRRLSKGDLIEIIYELKKNEEELKKQLQDTSEKLASRELKKAKAGSIAEAVISLNGVFEAAQKAADEYLQQVSEKKAEVDAECARMLAETDAACKKREQETEEKVNQSWETFRTRAYDIINAHVELTNLLNNR